MKKKTAILLGATGLTGGLLLGRLVRDEEYGSIKIFSRKTTGHASPKIEEYTGDVIQLEDFRKDFSGDVVFCCVGTTSSKTPDRKVYRDIDYGIPVRAATLASENGIPSFLVMSSMGANPKSRIFYSRTKGEMELDVFSRGIPHTYVLRPSLVLGKRKERRVAEVMAGGIMKAIGFMFVGGLRNYRAIEADRIAAAMIQLDKTRPDMKIVSSGLIRDLGDPAGKARDQAL